MTPSSSRRRIRVAAAALVEGGRVLIVRRSTGEVGAGGWEFPGGKIETGETPPEALVREVMEELSVSIGIDADLGWAFHAYENLDIDLNVFVCHRLKGEIVLHEHDALEWIEVAKLQKERLLPADWPFVERLQSWTRSQSSS